MLALSPSRHNNALGVLHFAHLYGRRRSTPCVPANSTARPTGSATFRARQNLFGADINFARLSGLLSRGGQIKATRLSDTFDWDQYQDANPGAIPLFVLDARGQTQVVTGPVTPLPGSC